MAQQVSRLGSASFEAPEVQPKKVNQLWWQRLLRSPKLWVSLILLVIYTLCLYHQYLMFSPDKVLEDKTVVYGLNDEALQIAAYWAIWTLLFWVLVFIWFDRWRSQRLIIWLWVLGWGATVSTWISIHVNTWAGEMMSVQGQAVDTGARPAIFIAPFIEEASKATVLFLLAMAIRHQLVSKMNLVSLAGLSAVGFAFTENIIYYARAYVYASTNIEVENPEEAMKTLVLLRGVLTSFGHPLFTAMTAMGLAIGLRAKSKLVRVLAPVTGFLVAASGHMLFNGLATMGVNIGQGWILIIVLVATIAFGVFGTIREGRRISYRLADYVQMGWLPARDAEVFSKFLLRTKLSVAAVFRGYKVFLATNRFIRGITELAYLRDSRTRGLVDETGISEEEALLLRLNELRSTALTDPKGLKVFIRPYKNKLWPRIRRIFFTEPDISTSPVGYPAPDVARQGMIRND